VAGAPPLEVEEEDGVGRAHHTERWTVRWPRVWVWEEAPESRDLAPGLHNLDFITNINAFIIISHMLSWAGQVGRCALCGHGYL